MNAHSIQGRRRRGGTGRGGGNAGDTKKNDDNFTTDLAALKERRGKEKDLPTVEGWPVKNARKASGNPSTGSCRRLGAALRREEIILLLEGETLTRWKGGPLFTGEAALSLKRPPTGGRRRVPSCRRGEKDSQKLVRTLSHRLATIQALTLIGRKD